FRNAGFDLADEIAADVRTLGEDAAAETGEDGDERGAKAECDERVDDFTRARLVAEEIREDPVVDGDAEEREARDQHAGDGTGAERDGQAGGEALAGRLSRADVGADRHVHAGEPGKAREDSADQEADRRTDGEKERD